MAVGSQVVGIVTGIAAKKVSEKALDSVWRKVKHADPPQDPASPGTPWAEALSWAAASGVAVGVARLIATKGVATARFKMTGKVPDGMDAPPPKAKATAEPEPEPPTVRDAAKLTGRAARRGAARGAAKGSD